MTPHFVALNPDLDHVPVSAVVYTIPFDTWRHYNGTPLYMCRVGRFIDSRYISSEYNMMLNTFVQTMIWQKGIPYLIHVVELWSVLSEFSGEKVVWVIKSALYLF